MALSSSIRIGEKNCKQVGLQKYSVESSLLIYREIQISYCQ